MAEDISHFNYSAVKKSLRRFCIDYRTEFIFGIVLLICALCSYRLARLIPVSFYDTTLSPILNGCIATTSLLGAVLLFRHHKGVRVRLLWAGVLLIWAVLASLLLLRVMAYNAPIDSDQTISLRGSELIIGNIYAWLLLLYPTAVLRPGWLNISRALLLLLPMAIVALLDYALPIDLRWLLAILPMLLMGILVLHIRAYRKWCEENYSSMDDIDVQWIWRYITMYLLSGGCYCVMSFSYTPAHAFTQQWLLLFMLAYSTEQILFRRDPWDMVRRARQPLPAPQPTSAEEETPELPYAEYRAQLEAWMAAEKPYLNPEFRLMDLRQIVPLNRTYLSQLINTEYNCNFYQYVTSYRINEAQRLMLEQPDMKLQDISDYCGFSSPTVFSRVFAREIGMTPSEWLAQQLSAH